MDRLTFEGLFCDIAQCSDTPDGSFCEYGMCSQRAAWERLKAYEDTGLSPEQCGELALALELNTHGYHPLKFCSYGKRKEQNNGQD